MAGSRDEMDDLAEVLQAATLRFYQPLSVATVLQFVRHADYAKIANVINNNPELMYQYAELEDGTFISPLKFAFKVYDKYTTGMMKEKVKNLPLLKHEFNLQASQQTAYISLDILFKAYITYRLRLQQYLDFQISLTDLNAAFIALAKIQREHLPANILKDFCRDVSSENMMAIDDGVLHPPTDCCVYMAATGDKVELDSTTFDAVFGVNFALFHGVDYAAYLVSGMQSMEAVNADLARLRALYDDRVRGQVAQLMEVQSLLGVAEVLRHGH